MEKIEIYKEICALFRHYSEASLKIRISTIAQGIVLLSASGYLIKENEPLFAVLSSLFGLAFTLALMVLHQSYQHKCSIFIDSASKIENESEFFTVKPMSETDEHHNKHIKTLLGDISIVKGLFILMILAFISILAIALTIIVNGI